MTTMVPLRRLDYRIVQATDDGRMDEDAGRRKGELEAEGEVEK